MTHEDDFPATQPVSSGHVLVVDDIEVNRILARAYLEMIGWTVHEADSGLRAMQFLAEKVPQAVLIDIRMPGISGDELVRHIRKKLGAGKSGQSSQHSQNIKYLAMATCAARLFL